jgi:hypothetical protein
MEPLWPRVNKQSKPACAAATPPHLVKEEARGGHEALRDAVAHLRRAAAARAR